MLIEDLGRYSLYYFLNILYQLINFKLQFVCKLLGMQNQTATVTAHQSTINPVFLTINTDPRSFFLTYIQPWFNASAIVENVLIVLVLVFCVRAQRRSNIENCGLAMVSRIYYTIIAIYELFSAISGYFLRDSFYFLSLLVRVNFNQKWS